MDYAQKTGKPPANEMAVWVRWIEGGGEPPSEIMAWARKEVAWRKVEPELRTDRVRPRWLQEVIEYAHETGKPLPAVFVVWVKWFEGSGEAPPEIMAWARQEVPRRREQREQWARMEIERRNAEKEAALMRQKAEQDRIAHEQEKTIPTHAPFQESQATLTRKERPQEMNERRNSVAPSNDWTTKLMTVLQFALGLYSEFQQFARPLPIPTTDAYGNPYNDDFLYGRIRGSLGVSQPPMIAANDNIMSNTGNSYSGIRGLSPKSPVNNGPLYPSASRNTPYRLESDNMFSPSQGIIRANSGSAVITFEAFPDGSAHLYNGSGVPIGTLQHQGNGIASFFDKQGMPVAQVRSIGQGVTEFRDNTGKIFGSARETLFGSEFRDTTGAVISTTTGTSTRSSTIRDATGNQVMTSETSR